MGISKRLLEEDYERIHLLESVYLQEVYEMSLSEFYEDTHVELGVRDEKERKWPFRKGKCTSVVGARKAKNRHKSLNGDRVTLF